MEKKKGGSKKHRGVPLLEQTKGPQPQDVQGVFGGPPLGGQWGSKRQQTAARILDPTESHPTDADRSMASKLTSHPATIQPNFPKPGFFRNPVPGDRCCSG